MAAHRGEGQQLDTLAGESTRGEQRDEVKDTHLFAPVSWTSAWTPCFYYQFKADIKKYIIGAIESNKFIQACH